MKNLLQVAWVLGQGFFLPMVLWLDDLRTSGNPWSALGVFALLEGMYLVDAVLFLKIFKGGQSGQVSN